MSDQRGATAANPSCPSCGRTLSGDDLEDLKCAECGADLPPRLGI